MKRTAIGLVLMFLGILGGGVHAQQESSQPSETGSGNQETSQEQKSSLKFEVRARKIDSWIEGNDRVTMLSGGTEIWREGFRVHAETIIGWNKTGKEEFGGGGFGQENQKRQFDRIYAEGNVQLEREKGTFLAQRLYFDLNENRGIAIEAKYRGNTVVSGGRNNEEQKLPIVVRAKELKQLDQDTYIGKDVSFTTCTYDDPHYVIGAKTIEITQEEEEDQIVMKDIIPKIQGVPFMYVPFVFLSQGPSSPLAKINYEQSNRKGSVIRTNWNTTIKKTVRDDEGNIVRDEEGHPKTKKWGDVGVRVDYMSERGLGFGPTLDYEWENYEGFVDTYFIHDSGVDADSSFDRRFLPQEKDNRGRIWWFHRQNFIEEDYENLRLDTEVKWISDRHFQPEFFEDEDEEGKEDETYAYLRYTRDNQFAKALVKPRINGFQTVDQRLPGFTYSVFGEPLQLGELPISYTTQTNLGNIHRVIDEDIAGRSGTQSWRFDSYHEFSFPFALDPVRITPLLGIRGSLYQHDRQEDQSLGRIIGTAGLRMNTQFYRTYGVSNESIGLDGLRHIIGLNMAYTNNVESSRETSDLPQFDTIDAREEFEELSLEIRNRFQTKGEEGGTHEFLDVGAGVEFYPKPNHARARNRTQNYLRPFNWIPTRRNPDGTIDDQNFSNVFLDMDFNPEGRFRFETNLEVDPVSSAFDAISSSLSYKVQDQMKFRVSHDFVKNVAETTDVSLTAKLTERWGFRGVLRYDFFRERWEEQLASFRYNFHDFNVDFGVLSDHGKEETAFTFSITPKFASNDFAEWMFGSYPQQDVYDYDTAGYRSRRH